MLRVVLRETSPVHIRALAVPEKGHVHLCLKLFIFLNSPKERKKGEFPFFTKRCEGELIAKVLKGGVPKTPVSYMRRRLTYIDPPSSFRPPLSPLLLPHSLILFSPILPFTSDHLPTSPPTGRQSSKIRSISLLIYSLFSQQLFWPVFFLCISHFFCPFLCCALNLSRISSILKSEGLQFYLQGRNLYTGRRIRQIFL